MSGSVRIKICGVTTPADAQAAVAAGADLIGLNFVPGSPRCLEIGVAVEVAQEIAGRVERVAVFRDEDPMEIERILRRIEVERVQQRRRERLREVALAGGDAADRLDEVGLGALLRQVAHRARPHDADGVLVLGVRR